MARARRRPAVGISLFPFLGVLASVIGTMTLVIAALAAGQFETSGGTAEAREVEAIEKRAAEYDRLGIEMEEWLARVRDDLRGGHAALKEELSRPLPPVKILPRGLGKELKPIFVETGRNGVSVPVQPPEVPRPLAVATPFIPESDGFRKVLALAGKDGDGGHIVLFLIRPDGAESYLIAEQVANAAGARHGKLPVPGLGPIDLSAFKQAKAAGQE
jgi:hypothetical protein